MKTICMAALTLIMLSQAISARADCSTIVTTYKAAWLATTQSDLETKLDDIIEWKLYELNWGKNIKIAPPESRKALVGHILASGRTNTPSKNFPSWKELNITVSTTSAAGGKLCIVSWTLQGYIWKRNGDPGLVDNGEMNAIKGTSILTLDETKSKVIREEIQAENEMTSGWW